MFLCHKLITITQLNFLLVLYFWSTYCRCLKKLLMKWAQFINNYQKSYTRKTNEEAVCLAVLFFYVLPRYTKQRQVKGSMFWLMCFQMCTPVHLGRRINLFLFTSGSIASSQRMPTEINESHTIAKMRISVESNTVKHLKTFITIFSGMPISLLILSW